MGPRAVSTPRKGIDVSNYQGDVNWAAVAKDGYTFAIIRCGSGWKGGWTDPKWATNQAGAKAAGLTVGAYYFAYPAQADPVREAARIVDLVQPKPGDIVPTLDLETAEGLTPTVLAAWAISWLHSVDARVGAKAMLYTYPNFLATSLAGGIAFADRPLWYASRNNVWPKVPAGFSAYNVLQTRDDGVVPGGVQGKVDIDVSYGLDRVIIPAAQPTPAPAPAPKPAPAPDLTGLRGQLRQWILWQRSKGVTWTRLQNTHAWKFWRSLGGK